MIRRYDRSRDPEAEMPYTLPPLPYDYGALEPHIDARLSDLSAVPENIRTAVRNNGGGHWNHSMFWQIMAPQAGGEPSGAVGDAIKSSFGGFDKFKEQWAA